MALQARGHASCDLCRLTNNAKQTAQVSTTKSALSQRSVPPKNKAPSEPTRGNEPCVVAYASTDAAKAKTANVNAALNIAPNDEVVRRAVAPANNEAALSQSSTYLLALRSHGPAIDRTDC